MGLPLSLFAFGQEGLALAVVYFGCTVTLQFTLGISLSAGNLSLSRLIRTPTIYAVAISILMLLSASRCRPGSRTRSACSAG